MRPNIPPVLIIFALVCFALVQNTQAVSPPPDGGYAGGNTAEGQDALLSLTTGTYNTAIGFLSLKSNKTGNFNTAIGAGTLFVNTADENTAIGAGALLSNTAGAQNTATGESALFSNTTGNANTANGANALVNNVDGDSNTANGNGALASNTTGNFNTAIGASALLNNTIGGRNTAIGRSALSLNTTGNFNAANGYQALFNNTTGNFNIALGNSAGASLTTGDSNIDIGNVGFPGESATIRIGGPQTKTFIAGIRGVTTGGTAIPVLIDGNSQLGTLSSARRFKKEIQPMDNTSEAILALKPVTFHYKSDNTNTPQFGLIAEEVAEVNPDLVVRDENGDIYTVRYEAVNAMLLNEFLKEHKKVEELEANAASQQKQIEALVTGLQKVTTKLSASKPAPQVVNNPERERDKPRQGDFNRRTSGLLTCIATTESVSLCVETKSWQLFGNWKR
jgi:Chaperone of endosialidase